eukprot:3426063-Rhodomonas_salina.3
MTVKFLPHATWDTWSTFATQWAGIKTASRASVPISSLPPRSLPPGPQISCQRRRPLHVIYLIIFCQSVDLTRSCKPLLFAAGIQRKGSVSPSPRTRKIHT